METDRDQEFALQGLAAGAVGAESLRAEGMAAFQAKDYAKAAELLQKATAADPKIKDGFRDLGRAFYELRRDEEAVAAFARQVEVEPFHEDAYAWRAHALGRLNRWDDAEKDLEKQIEVAPFKVWSYEKLAERRSRQARYAEASDLFARAATIEPKKAERWVRLGEAQARAGRADDARRSLETAATLEPDGFLKLESARAYKVLGDVAKAGELAESAAASLARRAAELAPSRVDESDLFWTDRLAEAWHLVGVSAAAAGNAEKAERYLDAAWQLSFGAESAWALGDLREKQGKLAQAVQMWSMAAAVPNSRYLVPEDRQARIQAAIDKLPPAASPVAPVPSWRNGPAKPAQQEAAEAHLMELRTIRLPGPVSADVTEDVLVLTDLEGRIERIVNVSRRNQAAFDRQVPKVGTARIMSPRPSGEPVKTLRRALLACSSVSGCALVLDLPGVGKVQTSGTGASARIASLEPKAGSSLVPGQTVTVKAMVHYERVEGFAVVQLGAVDQAGTPLFEPGVLETVNTAAGDVELKATFVVPSGATRVDVVVAFTSGSDARDTVLSPTSYTVKAP